MLSINDFSQKQILFLITKDGQKLSFRNDNVLIRDSNEKTVCQTTCHRLFAIFVVGHITITSGLIERAKKFGFAIVFMTSSFRPYQTLSAFAEGNTVLRKKQYFYDGTEAGKSLIENKIKNQRQLLSSIRNKSDGLKSAIACLDKYVAELNGCDSIQSIMGVEGSASKVYFRYYFDNVIWNGRKPRVKLDMTNTLLDIGYTILFSYIDALLSVFGFDRYNGILHRQFYMRKSLTCDMVEPFRVIIDRQVKKGINLKQFKERDFDIYDEKWVLKRKKSEEYCRIFMSEILNYKNEMYVYIRDFYRSFMRGNLEKSFPEWRLKNDSG